MCGGLNCPHFFRRCTIFASLHRELRFSRWPQDWHMCVGQTRDPLNLKNVWTVWFYFYLALHYRQWHSPSHASQGCNFNACPYAALFLLIGLLATSSRYQLVYCSAQCSIYSWWFSVPSFALPVYFLLWSFTGTSSYSTKLTLLSNFISSSVGGLE